MAIAVMAGLTGIALSLGAMALMNRYSLTPLNNGLVRLDQWTGEVTSCVPGNRPISARHPVHLVCKRRVPSPREWLEQKQRQQK
jgi:hypothetical protein